MSNQQLSRILQRYRDRGQRADRLTKTTLMLLAIIVILYVAL